MPRGSRPGNPFRDDPTLFQNGPVEVLVLERDSGRGICRDRMRAVSVVAELADMRSLRNWLDGHLSQRCVALYLDDRQPTWVGRFGEAIYVFLFEEAADAARFIDRFRDQRAQRIRNLHYFVGLQRGWNQPRPMTRRLAERLSQ